MTCAVGIADSTTSFQGGGAGSTPSAALHSIYVCSVPFSAAKQILVKHHYLHSLPGGTYFTFGAFLNESLSGAITFGAGPQNAFKLVDKAKQEDCLTLTRLWLSDNFPANSESRIIAICLRALKKYTHFKFVVTYADPGEGHVGIIYQATGFIYTGLSEVTPMFDMGDGKIHHSRSLSQSFGTHSLKYFLRNNLQVKVVHQLAKHRYIYFLDSALKNSLKTPTLPYPKKEDSK
jgi:hypothetical protein